MDTGWLTGLVGVVAAISSAVGTAVIMIMRERSKGRKETQEYERTERADAVTQYKEISDRQESHIHRLDEQVQRQQSAITRMYSALSDCRESEGTLYGHMQFLTDLANRHAIALREMGKAVDLPAPLPPRPQRISFGEEFEVRTTAQDSAILGKISREITPKEKPK